MKIFCLLALSAASLLFVSCAPSSPQDRITKYPALYKKQDKKTQQAISQGIIQQGMNMDAVFLAWGKAQRESDIFENNKRYTKWDYTKLTPIYRNTFFGGLSYGCRYNRHNLGLGTDVDFVPTKSSSVLFENNKVKSWEIVR